MPLPPGSRLGRRLVGGLLLAVLVSLACTMPASYADDGDDYPYAGLGKCPLVPLPPKPHGPKTQGPHAQGPRAQGTHQSGPGTPDKPGKPGDAGQPGPDAPPPPRQCAKHIWYYNGSYGDPWGFALRNCTSFVAWRLRETNGLADFDNYFGGVHWGNASHWDAAARSLGYLVDDVPAVGAVAQTDDGSKGHVAWVESIGDETVTVEEYNYGVAGGYDVRTVPTSSFRYLHLQDLAPDPGLGSTRAGVATTDSHGGSWSARTTADGDLVVRRPSGHSSRLGAAGGWSSEAAPALLTDGRGRVWVAAVTTGGRVLTMHTGATAAFSRPRPASTGSQTSSPTLAVDATGHVHLLAVTSGGTLLERHTTGIREDRWDAQRRLGLAGSFSTQAAPAAALDLRGRLWVAAVTRHGHLLAQHTRRDRHRWSGFRAIDGRTWSVTSSPALATAPAGELWLAAVDDGGSLVVRRTRSRSDDRWRRTVPVAGRWSPYSSPVLRTDRNGRTWLAAVRADGDLAVLWDPTGGRRWHASGGLPRVPSSQTASPALAATVGGVLVGATDAHGGLVWRRPLDQSGLPAAHGARGGSFSVSPFL